MTYFTRESDYAVGRNPNWDRTRRPKVPGP